MVATVTQKIPHFTMCSTKTTGDVFWDGKREGKGVDTGLEGVVGGFKKEKCCVDVFLVSFVDPTLCHCFVTGAN